MEKKEETNFYKRFIKACSGLRGIVHKDSKGFGYTYCSLPQILSAMEKVFPAYNIGVFQIIKKNGGVIISTSVVDLVGDKEKIVSELSLPDQEAIYKEKLEFFHKILLGNPPVDFINFLTKEIRGYSVNQEIGAAITYMRRYALATILNIQPEDDFGGHSAKKFKMLENAPLDFGYKVDKAISKPTSAAKDRNLLEEMRNK